VDGYNPDNNTLAVTPIGMIQGAAVAPEINSEIGVTQGYFDYYPTENDVGRTAAGYLEYKNQWITYCPTSVVVNDIGCSDILSVYQDCVNETIEQVYLYSLGDALRKWTTDCPNAVLEDEFSQNTIMMIETPLNFSCSISVEVTDSCFGRRTCAQVIGTSCCTEGYDLCHVCGGDGTSCLDCNGIAFGGATLDSCGVCGGDDSTCCENYLGINNALWDYVLVPEAVNDVIARLESTYAVLEWTWRNLPEMEDLPERITCEQIGTIAEIDRMFLFNCGNQFCVESGEFLTTLQIATNNFII